MKQLILASLFFTQTVFAGLPPTTVKGQSETAGVTTFNVQAPYNQATTVGAGTRLLETGNKNLLLNSSFEATTPTTSWTVAAGSSAVVETTHVEDGKKSLKVTMTAATGTSLSQDVTPVVQTEGQNMEYGVWLKTTLTTLQVCARQAAAEVGSCSNVLSDNVWHFYAVNYPGVSSGSLGVSVKSTASTSGDYYVDEGYVGRARNIGSANFATDWADETSLFTINGVGTVSNAKVLTRKVGDTLEVQGFFRSGTASASSWNISNTKYVIDSTKLSSNAAGTYVGEYIISSTTSGNIYNAAQMANVLFYDGSTTDRVFVSYIGSTTGFVKLNGNDPGGSSNSYHNFKMRIPIIGATGQTAVRMDQSNTDWQTYVPTITGFGTPTAVSAEWRRNGDSIEIKGTFTSGTSTAVEARFSLPNSLTTAGTTKIPTIRPTGTLAANFNQASAFTILMEPSVGYVTFGNQDSTHSGIAKLNGSAFLGSGNQVYFTAGPIPIATWSSNQNAPLLVGGVTSSSTGLTKVEHLVMSGSTCTASPCGVAYTTIAGTTVARSGTGAYPVTWGTAWSSANYSCTLTSLNNAAAAFGIITAKSTTGITITSIKPSDEQLRDAAYDVICVGPR